MKSFGIHILLVFFGLISVQANKSCDDGQFKYSLSDINCDSLSNSLVDSSLCFYIEDVSLYVFLFKVDNVLFAHQYYIEKEKDSTFCTKKVFDVKNINFSFKEFYYFLFDEDKKYDLGNEDDTGVYIFNLRMGNTIKSRLFRFYSAHEQIFKDSRYHFLVDLRK